MAARCRHGYGAIAFFALMPGGYSDARRDDTRHTRRLPRTPPEGIMIIGSRP